MMNASYLGQLGEILLDGGSWRLYRGGIISHGKTILWHNVEEIFISGTKSSVEFVPAGEKITIKIVDCHKNRVKIAFSGFFRMDEAQKHEFTTVYSFILQNVWDHQWTRFLKRLKDGERISFGSLDVSSDGIYYQKIFGHELIKETSVTGHEIRNGNFYVQHLNNNGKPTEKNIYIVENIPNIHILQAFLKEISGQNIRGQG